MYYLIPYNKSGVMRCWIRPFSRMLKKLLLSPTRPEVAKTAVLSGGASALTQRFYIALRTVKRRISECSSSETFHV
jgi:hypothetical protein